MAVPRAGTRNDGNAISGAVKTAPYVTVEKFGCTCNDKPANNKKLHGGLPCSFSLSKNYPNGLDSGIRVMDYEWLYDRLTPYYCHDNGRPGTDPVVLIKMVLIQHLSASAFRTS